jgi:enoyl-CoA hydratase
MAREIIVVSIDEGVATLVIDRQEALNALNIQVLEELDAALESLDAEGSVRALVITGAGKAFVAGADIRAIAALSPSEAVAFSRRGQATMLSIGRLTKPVIAAVNGYALGGGLELALACDFIYASSLARLGLPEASLGVIPGFGGTRNLARLIGPARARELVLTGANITAEKALAWGLVNEVFEPDQLLPKARERAIRIAEAGPLAVRAAREAMAFGLDTSLKESLEHEAALFGLLFASADQKEGMAAFLEKRKPNFTGN